MIAYDKKRKYITPAQNSIKMGLIVKRYLTSKSFNQTSIQNGLKDQQIIKRPSELLEITIIINQIHEGYINQLTKQKSSIKL